MFAQDSKISWHCANCNLVLKIKHLPVTEYCDSILPKGSTAVLLQVKYTVQLTHNAIQGHYKKLKSFKFKLSNFIKSLSSIFTYSNNPYFVRTTWIIIVLYQFLYCIVNCNIVLYYCTNTWNEWQLNNVLWLTCICINFLRFYNKLINLLKLVVAKNSHHKYCR